MNKETTITPGRIIRMEGHQFEQIPRSIDYNRSWGALKHPEDAIQRTAQFLQHPEDQENAHCLN